ncbi:DNA pilot protein [Dipodfec virus UOA04_Rod_446]|nr:DNA pilot protein [Dipodfec virus UOA04_Rod_446]
MDPVIGSALISGGSGLIGNALSGIFGSHSNKKSNETNMKINQMNNEFNKQEAAANRAFIDAQRNAQNQWNRQQWQMENEYNSAASQRKRLEEAGLNPYLMMSGGSAGTASSVSGSGSTSGSQASAAAPIAQTPYRPNIDLTSVSDAINSYYTNRAHASATVGQDISNQFDMQFGSDARKASIASSLDGRFELLDDSYRHMRQSSAPAMALNDLNMRFQSLESLKIHQEMERASASLAYVNAETGKILNRFLPAQQQGDLFVKASQIYRNYADGKLSEAKLNTEITQQVLNSVTAAGKRISNRIAFQTANGIIQAMNKENAYNADYYRFLRRSAPDLVGYDVDDARLNNLMNKHEEKLKKTNRKWRTVDKITTSVGNLISPAVSYGAGYYRGRNR